MYDNMAVARDGSIYYTVYSTRFGFHEGLLQALVASDGDGRIVK